MLPLTKYHESLRVRHTGSLRFGLAGAQWVVLCKRHSGASVVLVYVGPGKPWTAGGPILRVEAGSKRSETVQTALEHERS